MRPCIALAVGFLLVVSPLRGQTPRLTVEVDTAVVTVGDVVTLRVSVDHAAGDRVLWPDSLDLAPFEITGARAFPPAAQGERMRSAAVFSLVAFELGDLEIPSFQVEVLNETGESAILSTNPFGIRVVSVGLEEGGDIREIKGPLGIPLSVARVLLLALAALITVVVVWAFYRKMKGREHGMPAPVSTPHSRPPHEVALEALARLEESPLLERGEVKEFHIQASDILRSYVEGRFRVAALEMTTVDILGSLEGIGTEAPLVGGFRDFLDPCDMVKFAKTRPSTESSLSTLRAGRRLVEETIPAPEPQPPEALSVKAENPEEVSP